MNALKYEDVDFTGWPTRPTKEAYDLWQKVKKQKHRLYFTQTSINRMTKHIVALDHEMVSATKAVEIAEEGGWRTIKFNWVMNAIARDQIAPSPELMVQPWAKGLIKQ